MVFIPSQLQKDLIPLLYHISVFKILTGELILDENQKINFQIEESSTQLDQVVINVDESDKLSIRDPQMSVTKSKN